ncbi:MAG: metal transporter [Cereibacter sp.]|nr:metal transporter [Cereibacter sp.]
MFLQIFAGSLVLLASILVMAPSAWLVETAFLRFHGWLISEPHGPKLILVVAGTALWALAMLTVGVWLWTLTFWQLGAFATMEESLYFSMVTFTTLGYGDVLMPHRWRILGAMAAANGLLNFGLLTALLVEALRHVRMHQVASRRR